MAITFEWAATKIIVDIGNENLFVFLVMAVIILHLIVLREIRKRTIRFANYETLKKALGMELFKSNLLVLILRILIVVSLVLALYKFDVEIIKPVGDVDFAIAIDVSQTMLNSDDGMFTPNKLQVAKDTAKEIISYLPERTSISVISFSGNAYIESSLTSDKKQIYMALDSLTSRPPAGTAIGDALLAGVIALSNSTKEKKAIILITDGRQTPGLGVGINESLRSVIANGIVVNTIGLGKKNRTVINLSDIDLESVNIPEEIKEEILRMQNMSYNVSSLDEETLIFIANQTQGRYFYVANESALKDAFSDAVLKFNSVTLDLRKYALLFAVILLLIEYLLGATRYKTIP